MRLSQRAAWLLLVLGVGLFLALLFRAFIIANVLTPIALFFLMIWRLIISVHQAVYWGIVLVAAVGLAFFRLIQVAAHIEVQQYTPPPQSIMQNINYWRLTLQLASDGGPSATSMKGELLYNLVAMYATKQSEAAPFAIREALQARQLPLPEPVYNFLFYDETQETNLSWKERLQRLAAKPGKWIRRWTGREKADFYRAVEDTITFMEELMEIKHGNDYFDNPNPDL